MSLIPRSRAKWAKTLAFLAVCVVVAGLILIHEFTKGQRFLKFSKEIPEIIAPSLTQAVLFDEKFQDPALLGWRDEERNGHTQYSTVVEPDGSSVLKASSDRSASALIKKIEFSPARYPYLRWRWRVDKMTERADMRTLGGSDAPARIYVAFSHGLGPWNTRLINYVWASSEPQGAVINSFFSPNSKILVLESGPALEGKWVSEARNIYEDYRNLFGEEPPRVGAVALMTDSDNTQTEALAYYADIVISSQP